MLCNSVFSELDIYLAKTRNKMIIWKNIRYQEMIISNQNLCLQLSLRENGNTYFLVFIIKRHCLYIITTLCSRTNASFLPAPLRQFAPPRNWSEKNRKNSITKEVCITIVVSPPRKTFLEESQNAQMKIQNLLQILLTCTVQIYICHMSNLMLFRNVALRAT